MSKIRIEPLSAIVRIYEEDIDNSISIENMSQKYYKTLALTFSDNGTVRVQGSVFSPNYSEYKEICNILKNMGYSTVEWRHKDKLITRLL